MLHSVYKKTSVLWSRLAKSVWLFPAILTAILLVLTICRISGSSIGIYHDFFYGNSKDSHLLYGTPQPIRSDEWLVNTQLAIAQARDNFPHINENITTGRDMSLNIDVPYKEWSTIFKPQNLAFLILPLEVAFAFKWWIILYLLILSVYFFTLRLFPDRRLLVVFIALGFSFSPFIFWWYQSFTLMSLAYGFFIMIVGLRVLNGEAVRLPGRKALSRRASFIIYSLLLTYLLVSFALVLYPPFQIPIALGVVAFLGGYLLQLRFAEKKYKSFGQMLRPLGIFAVALVMAGLIGLAFVATRSQAISSIVHTVYPGSRVVASGGFPSDRLTATFLQPQLQRDVQGPHYYTNQSESSNFILLLPYLILPGIVVTIAHLRKRGRPDWVFLAIQACVLLFLANLFVPGLQAPYHLLGLDKVPHERLIMGLGFIGIIHMLYLMKLLAGVKISARKLTAWAAAYTGVCLAFALLVGKYTREHFSAFISSWPLIIMGALLFCLIIYVLLIRRFVVAALLLMLFSFLSVVRIHPLYQGLGVAADNRVTDTMRSVSKPEDTWVALDQILLENFGLLSDRDSMTGVQFYPDLTFWRQLQQGPEAEKIYNRYAHVLFTANPEFPPVQLMQVDSFIVQFSCSSFVRSQVEYVLAQHPLYYGCVEEVSTVKYPAQTFFLYRVR
jgi:hypothetical protein